jgi:hypothetical protein
VDESEEAAIPVPHELRRGGDEPWSPGVDIPGSLRDGLITAGIRSMLAMLILAGAPVVAAHHPRT